MDQMTINEVLEMAVAEEIKASQAYLDMASSAESEELRDLLLGFARQEDEHRKALEQAMMGDLSVFAGSWPDQRELSAPSAPVELGPDAGLARGMLVAIERERRAFQLYTSLSGLTEDAGLKTIFDALARQEATHWHALEVEYDRLIAL